MRNVLNNCLVPRFCGPWVILVLFFFLASACPAQKRMVQRAAARFRAPSVMILMPDYVFKKNNKTAGIKAFGTMTPLQQDSALYYSSRFIRFVSDSVVLEAFLEALAGELGLYGFDVYSEGQLDTFLQLPEPAWIFSVAQLELEEDHETVLEKDVFDDTLSYQKSFTLNYLRFNAWFELSALNADSIRPEVLFSSFFMQDQLKGRFWRNPLEMEVKYRYKLLEIRQEDIQGLVDFAGKKNASYLFDYLFNASLKQDSRFDHGRYWHFNRLKGSVKEAGDNRFTVLDDAGGLGQEP